MPNPTKIGTEVILSLEEGHGFSSIVKPGNGSGNETYIRFAILQ